MPKGAVYVGRPSRWGNEFTPEMLDLFDRPLGMVRVLDLYRLATLRFLDEGPPDVVEAWLAPLRDASALVCWCPVDKPCHADLLIEILGMTAPREQAPR